MTIFRNTLAAILCFTALGIASVAHADEPSAAGLWQKIDDGKPVAWFLVVDHNGLRRFLPRAETGRVEPSARSGDRDCLAEPRRRIGCQPVDAQDGLLRVGSRGARTQGDAERRTADTRQIDQLVCQSYDG